MEVFTWMPGSPETIEQFNERIAEFCLQEEANVVDILSSIAGPVLVLSLAQADDLAFVPAAGVLMPIIALIERKDLPNLEAKLSEMVDAIKAQDTDNDPRVPVAVRVHLNEQSQSGYAVALVNIGAIESEEVSQ